jgi:hypothetical protein
MAFSLPFSIARSTGLVAGGTLLLLTNLTPAAPAQTSSEPGETPTEVRPLNQSASLLSLVGGERLMEEASTAIAAQDYDLAVIKLQEARQVLNQISGYYQELTTLFTGVDSRIADSNRQKALESAQMRDEASYQLALVHRAQNKPDLAVPLLMEVLRSQQPTRDLGQRAYQQLFELGFVERSYPSGS